MAKDPSNPLELKRKRVEDRATSPENTGQTKRLRKQQCASDSALTPLIPAQEGKDTQSHVSRRRSSSLQQLADARIGQLQDQASQSDVSSARARVQVDSAASNLAGPAKKKRKHERGDRVEHQSSAWALSAPKAGQFIDHPPLFVGGETRILLATQFYIGAFSTSSSLIDTSYSPPSSGDITSFAVSSIDPGNVYVGTRRGLVFSWNWKDGKMNGRWMTNTPIYGIACGQLKNSEHDTILTIDQSESSWNITAHRFNPGRDQHSLTTLLKYGKSLRAIRISSDCRAIAALTPEGIILGRLASGNKQSLKRMSYEWRELPCKEPTTSLEMRLNEHRNGELDVDIVIGGLKGTILLYRQIFAKTGFGDHQATLPISKRSIVGSQMHWHRGAVGALAFSHDADYLISGGLETVLVLWQLSTGRKQFLPHLESPIHSITVSPSGKSYAVGLADNSTMILSTAELRPTANITGLQTPATLNLPPHQLMLPTRELFEQAASETQAPMVSGTVDPANPMHGLFTVPLYQSGRTEFFPQANPRPFVQTFSLSSTAHSGHLSRQALARTNVTNSNLGPGGVRIGEAHIRHLAISTNGKWLATVDEWCPPHSDIEDLITSPGDKLDEKANHLHVSIRFWSTNELDSSREGWILNSRVDNPHMLSGSRKSGKVLALAASPTSSGFVSIGEDGALRIWRPKSRAPDGRVYWGETAPLKAAQRSSKRAQGKINTWWSVQHLITLHAPVSDELRAHLQPVRATVAFSRDGSLLALHIHYSTASKPCARKRLSVDEHSDYEDPVNTTVHFVDVDMGMVRELRSDLCPRPEPSLTQHGSMQPQDGIWALGFLDTCLIVLTRQAASVWETTSFQLLQIVRIPSTHSTNKHPEEALKSSRCYNAPAPLLAVNALTRSFAISTAIRSSPSSANHLAHGTLPPHAHRDYTSRVQVYEVDASSLPQVLIPVFDMITQRLILCVLDAAGSAVEGDSEAKRKASHHDGVALTRHALMRGYHLIDSAATVRTVRPQALRTAGSSGTAHVVDAQDESLAEAENDWDAQPVDEILQALVSHLGDVEQGPNTEEEQASVTARPRSGRIVTAEQLSSALELTTAHTSTPLTEIFHKVVRLFAGKAVAA